MSVAVFVRVLLVALAWAVSAADQPREVFGAIRRTAKEDPLETRPELGLELTPDLKTAAGQKSSSDEYRTLSSLTSDRAVAANVDVRPSPPTVADPLPAPPPPPPPPPSSFITRGRYFGGNRPYPYLYGSDDGGRAYRPDFDDDASDRIPEYPTSSHHAVPNWNRFYYPSGHRQLKKYGPVIMETDVSVSDGGGGGGGDVFELEYNNNNNNNNNNDAASFEHEIYRNPTAVGVGGGENVVGWYGGEPAALASRPSAEVRDPAASKTVTVNVKKLVLLAAIKAALAKVKVLAVLKFLAILFVKVKLLALLKVFLFAKFHALNKLLKLFVLPFLPGLLLWLRTAALLQLNPALGMALNNNGNINNNMDMNVASTANVAQLRNDSAADPAANMRSTAAAAAAAGHRNDAAQLLRFVAAVQSIKCTERTACRVAGVEPLSIQSVWTNWILSSMVDYIPNRKLKSYVSTFKDVSDYRLENIFSRPTTEEWLKWCNEHYYCTDDDDDDDDDDDEKTITSKR